MANFRTLKIHKDSYMLAKFYLAENQLQTGSLIFFLFVINQIYMHVADKGQYIYKGGKGQIKIQLRGLKQSYTLFDNKLLHILKGCDWHQ